MSSHPLRLYLDADKNTQYTTGVTSTSTYTEITVASGAPSTLFYQCSIHAFFIVCFFIYLYKSTKLFIWSAFSYRLPYLIVSKYAFYNLLASKIQKSNISIIISTYFMLFVFGPSISI